MDYFLFLAVRQQAAYDALRSKFSTKAFAGHGMRTSTLWSHYVGAWYVLKSAFVVFCFGPGSHTDNSGGLLAIACANIVGELFSLGLCAPTAAHL